MTVETWHEGELALQQLAGSRERLAEIGPRVIRDHMPEQHREFFTQLPFLIAGSVDSHGQPWASVLAGEPGFVSSPDAWRLSVHARPLAPDPLRATLAAGMPIGLLGIEPHTRRRNRMNGNVTHVDAEGFEVEVGQSFGNCPKYIQARRPEFIGSRGRALPARSLAALDAASRAIVERADTFFIASAHPLAADGSVPALGVDVSHRGGKPGFVRVNGDEVLTAPDFLGNAFFNTLGNLAINPRCGLLFIDFDSGDLLYIAATAQIIHDGAQLESFQGAQRLMRFQIVSVLHAPAALPLRWSEAQLSPVLAATGAWR
jgi:uncharacterized protein